MKRIATILAFFLMGGLFLLYVWVKMDNVRVGYTLQQLEQEKARLLREQEELFVVLSQLTSPDHIAQQAAAQLDMVRPAPGQIILVRSERSEPRQNPNTQDPVRLVKLSKEGKQ